MDKNLNNREPNLSIIVPVYNVEKYLVRCLDSIFNQNFSGTFEVIAVDDASTDNSLEILKSYSKNELRLKIIEHKSNKNLSISRATGILHCKGDYIMHIDSDDWILPGTFENLFSKCLETSADVIVFNYLRENYRGLRKSVNNIYEQVIHTDKIKVQHLFFGTVWNKIIRRNLAENLVSGQIGLNHAEDLVYSIEILLRADKICLLPESYYVYCINSDSLTMNVKPHNFIEKMCLVLMQLNKVVSKYQTKKEFDNYLMDYFEKFIYLELAKIHFYKRNKLNSNTELLFKNLFKVPLMNKDRVVRLERSINNKYINIIEVARRFGVKTSLSIILKSLH